MGIESIAVQILNIREPLPYRKQADREQKLFRGPNDLLKVYDRAAGRDILATNLNGGKTVLIPKGESFAELHFATKYIYSREDLTFEQKGLLSRKGVADLACFVESINRNSRLREIDYIIGTTNPELARVAVDHFGFHYLNENEPKSRISRLKGVRIFATRDELLSQSGELKSRSERLNRIRSSDILVNS